MRVLADTNVLARLAQPSHSHHSVARDAFERLRTNDHELCLVPQVLYEFWVVATRPVPENGLGMTVAQARAELAEIKALTRLYRDERAVLDHWERLIADHDVKGKGAHDARLVAAMLRHGLTHVLTFDAQDFARFTEIAVLAPSEVALSAPGV